MNSRKPGFLFFTLAACSIVSITFDACSRQWDFVAKANLGEYNVRLEMSQGDVGLSWVSDQYGGPAAAQFHVREHMEWDFTDFYNLSPPGDWSVPLAEFRQVYSPLWPMILGSGLPACLILCRRSARASVKPERETGT